MRGLQREHAVPLGLVTGLLGLIAIAVAAFPGDGIHVIPAAAAGAASIALAVAGGTRSPPSRHGWMLLALWASLGMIVHLLATVAVVEPAVDPLATLVHILAAPVAIASLSVLFRSLHAPGELLRRLLDGWLYAGTVLAVVVQFLVIPATDPGRLAEPGPITSFGYFAFDLTAIVVLAGFVLRGVGVSRPVVLAGALGVVAAAAADGLDLAAELGVISDRKVAAGFAAATFVLVGCLPYAGGLGRSVPPYPRRVSVSALAAPYTAALIGGGSLAGSVMAGVSLRPVPVALITSVVLALVVRQGLTLLDNVRLTSELAQRENHFRSLVLGSSDVIMVSDRDGVVEYTSPAMARIFGYGSEEIVGTHLAELLHPHDVADALDTVRRFWSSDVPHTRIEARLRAAGGTWRHTESTLSRDGEQRLIMNVRDVSDRVELRRELERLALHDTLTGLPNRVRLTARLASAIQARAAGGEVGVIFIDLDGLKEVNDSSGHEAGDAVLVEAARRIVAAVGQADLVARFGGDEFVVVLDRDATRESVLGVAQAIVGHLGSAFEVDGRNLTLSASAGVAFAEDGPDVAELLRAADLAMYRAKVLGRGRIEVFHPQLRAAAESRAELNSRLVRALDQQDFALQYQPVVELASGRVVAFEALMRWRSEGGILVTPKELIRLAEDSGHIAELGRWVVAESVAQSGQWRREGNPVELSVNLSVAQVDDPHLVEVIAGALRSHGVPPDMLTLEITESLLLERVDEAVNRLGALRSLGVRIVLDDFGTGYSSLAYLTRLPVDGLKLDASFVRRLGDDAATAAVAAAVVRLGHDLGLVITAEGVETAGQAQALQSMGCHRAQGFHYSGPLDVESVGQVFSATFGRRARPPRNYRRKPAAASATRPANGRTSHMARQKDH